jgi:hypothetical protein
MSMRSLGNCSGLLESLTLPLLLSTHIAFFFWSIHRGPATVAVMVEGGTCRRPGPSLRGRLGLDGIGRTSGQIVSPGRTSFCEAIGLEL